jgi:hypothetical protein
VDDHHFAASFVCFHDTMGLTDLLEAENPGWLRPETPRGHLFGTFWSGTSDTGNCGVPNTKLPKNVR